MEFPKHPIFQDPVFETSEYKTFELRVRGAMAISVEQDPHTIAIQKAIPAVNDRLRTMTGVIQNGQAIHAQALSSLGDLLTTRLEQRIEQRIEHLTDTLNEFIGGSFHFVPRGGQLASALVASPNTGAPSLLKRLAALPVAEMAQATGTPQYHMSRTIQTIPELWQEWTVGLQGQPSIESLDKLYGSSWRSGPTAASERQFYSRRKTLITEIRRLATAIKASPDEETYNKVVIQLESERRTARASLNKVIDTLKRM